MDIFDRLKTAASVEWESYVDHAFVRQMGDGPLPQVAFCSDARCALRLLVYGAVDRR